MRATGTLKGKKNGQSRTTRLKSWKVRANIVGHSGDSPAAWEYMEKKGSVHERTTIDYAPASESSPLAPTVFAIVTAAVNIAVSVDAKVKVWAAAIVGLALVAHVAETDAAVAVDFHHELRPGALASLEVDNASGQDAQRTTLAVAQVL